MNDPAFEDYCEQIEREFFRFKGRPGTLSPADFNRTLEWFRAGIPLNVVLEAIPDAFQTQSAGREGGVQEVNTLRYCEPFVERALARRNRVQ